MRTDANQYMKAIFQQKVREKKKGKVSPVFEDNRNEGYYYLGKQSSMLSCITNGRREMSR